MIDIRAVCKIFLDFIYDKEILPVDIIRIIDLHHSRNEPYNSIKWDIRRILSILKYRENFMPLQKQNNMIHNIENEIREKVYLLDEGHCDRRIRRWLSNSDRNIGNAINFCNDFFHNVENDSGIKTFCENLRELIETSGMPKSKEYSQRIENIKQENDHEQEISCHKRELDTTRNQLMRAEEKIHDLEEKIKEMQPKPEAVKNTNINSHFISESNTSTNNTKGNTMISCNLNSDILEFIKQPLPKNLNVVSGSVPVPFFGDIRTAQAATISLNPSNNEFCVDKTTELLPMSEKRFVDREALGISDSDSLSDEQAEEVFSSYCTYFHKNPYMRWFSKLNTFIKYISDKKFSYEDGGLMHLDIAPYATDPIWSNLSERTKEGLFQPYRSIGLKIIECSDLKYLFVNGRTTKDNVENYLGVSLKLEKRFQAGQRKCEIYTGKYKQCKIIAWNLDVPNGAPNEQKEAVYEVFKRINNGTV